jgi:hypothetical protein
VAHGHLLSSLGSPTRSRSAIGWLALLPQELVGAGTGPVEAFGPHEDARVVERSYLRPEGRDGHDGRDSPRSRDERRWDEHAV